MQRLPFVKLIRLSPSIVDKLSKQNFESKFHVNEENVMERQSFNLNDPPLNGTKSENIDSDETFTSSSDDETNLEAEDTEILSSENGDEDPDFKITSDSESVNSDTLKDSDTETKGKKAGGYMGPYICRLCHKIFKGTQNLRSHIINQHLPPVQKGSALQFKCIKCDKSFTKCTSLNSHYFIHWDPKDRPYHCPNLNCSLTFGTAKQLRSHSLSHSSVIKPYSCKICAQIYRHKNNFNHHVSESRPLQCNFCNEKFCTDYRYSQHMKVHEKNDQKSYICNICGENIKLSERKAHMKTHCKIQSPRYKCNFCSKIFKSQTGLEIHLRSHTREMPYKCKICNKQFAQRSNIIMRTHASVHQVHKYEIQCPKCFLKFKDKPGLLTHQLMCGKVENFATELLRDDLRHKTTKGPVYKCNKCDKTFNRKEYLRDHVMRYHLKLKPYECSYCDMKFIHRTELSTHNRIHTDEKPFKCDVCGKEFRQSTHLNNHKIIHSEKRPFQCPQCPKAFKTKKTLNSHILLHTKELPYPCSKCDKAFPRLYVLKRHVNVHHLGIRPFECLEEDCGKIFFSKTELKSHGKSHSDERPFTCVICCVAYKTNGKLLEHCRISKRHIQLIKLKSVRNE